VYRVVYSPQAEAPLLALFSQIALAASPQIAARYTDAIVDQCESLSTFPMRGAQRDDLYPGLRVFGFRRRVSIAFGVAGSLVTIAGVFHGGQDLEEVFEDWSG
jgi:toxin ParE1/3/4